MNYKSRTQKNIDRKKDRDQVTVTLDAELLTRLSQLAEEGHRSRNMQICMILEEFVDQKYNSQQQKNDQ